MPVPVTQWPLPATATATSFSGSTMPSGTNRSARDWYGPSLSMARRQEDSGIGPGWVRLSDGMKRSFNERYRQHHMSNFVPRDRVAPFRLRFGRMALGSGIPVSAATLARRAASGARFCSPVGMPPSKRFEILTMLPVGDLGVEALDLGVLDVDVVVDELLPQRLPEKCVVTQGRHRLAQAFRQQVRLGLVGRIGGRPGIELAIDAVEAGENLLGHVEIR